MFSDINWAARNHYTTSARPLARSASMRWWVPPTISNLSVHHDPQLNRDEADDRQGAATEKAPSKMDQRDGAGEEGGDGDGWGIRGMGVGGGGPTEDGTARRARERRRPRAAKTNYIRAYKIIEVTYANVLESTSFYIYIYWRLLQEMLFEHKLQSMHTVFSFDFLENFDHIKRSKPCFHQFMFTV